MTIHPVEVLDALAWHLDQAGVATYVPSGKYPANPAKPAIFHGQFLTDAPDRALTINLYNTDPDIFTVSSTPLMYVQLRWRGTKDPRTVQTMAFEGFKTLHTLTPGYWSGGVAPLSVLRTIDGPIDPDANGRWTKPDSYAIRLNPGETL